MRRLFLIALCLLGGITARAQELNPDDYIFPVQNVAGLFSSNFGEMRPNHFHSGVDIKTDGVTGKSVIAVADGYICRIAVTPGGYGRAIYIAHPNGTTSVYGHLSVFRSDIEKYVHEERYRTRQNSINLYPSPDKFPLKQGDEFAKSGNTGASSGPHLHFEIRDSRTQRTLNTISSGVIRSRDQIPPLLVKLHYVEVDTVGGVPVHATPRAIELAAKAPGQYVLKQDAPLPVGNRGYFILEATDRKDGVSNTFGVWRVSETVDNEKIFELRIDGFAFDETRYCNAVACYPMQVGSRNELIRLTQMDGCIDAFYPVMKNRALLTPAEGQVQQVRIEAEDDSGNISTLEFTIVGQSSDKNFRASCDSSLPVIDNRSPFYRDEYQCSVEIPAGTFYEPIFYRSSSRPSGSVSVNTVSIHSPVFSILDSTLPLHKAAKITIQAMLPPDLQPHASLGFVRNNRVSFAGGKYKDGAVSVNTRTLGEFCVVVDTVPPKITPQFNADEPIKSRSISFKWSDNYSGLGSYTATIDGKWVLLDRNPMNGTITHTFDDSRTPKGESYLFKLTVTDNCGNKTVWEKRISR